MKNSRVCSPLPSMLQEGLQLAGFSALRLMLPGIFIASVLYSLWGGGKILAAFLTGFGFCSVTSKDTTKNSM